MASIRKYAGRAGRATASGAGSLAVGTAHTVGNIALTGTRNFLNLASLTHQATGQMLRQLPDSEAARIYNVLNEMFADAVVAGARGALNLSFAGANAISETASGVAAAVRQRRATHEELQYMYDPRLIGRHQADYQSTIQFVQQRAAVAQRGSVFSGPSPFEYTGYFPLLTDTTGTETFVSTASAPSSSAARPFSHQVQPDIARRGQVFATNDFTAPVVGVDVAAMRRMNDRSRMHQATMRAVGGY